jgi:hypothetical protein
MSQGKMSTVVADCYLWNTATFTPRSNGGATRCRRFRRDVWYVDHWSLWLDFKILLRTAWKVLKREGVSAEGHVTMPKFTGSKKILAEPQKAEAE